MSNQEEIKDLEQFEAEAAGEEDNFVEMNDEARVAFTLYLDVVKSGKVTKEGTLVPPLNIHKISRLSEVSPKLVSKCFDRVRNKGFLANNDNGELLIPDIIEFENWLKAEGAYIE